MDDEKAWFAQKSYGFGAGVPIRWQGWVLLGAFGAAVGCALWLFGPDDERALAIVIPATAALLLITARTTRGGWRWRWGSRP